MIDFTPILSRALSTLWWLLPVVIILTALKTRWFKGVVGEAAVNLVAKLRLPADTYHPVHNVTLPTPDGTTQIDHVFVSRFGIFVLETKNMQGWIFGTEHQAQWTQKIYKKSFRFQNPLRQNYKHVKALESLLGVSVDAIHSVIVFTGQSTFKATMPENVKRGMGYIAYIKSFRTPVFSEDDVQNILTEIQSVRLEPTRATNRRHVQQLKARNDISAARQCPKCASAMVVRTAQRGADAGSQFWGCSAYPTCRAMHSID